MVCWRRDRELIWALKVYKREARHTALYSRLYNRLLRQIIGKGFERRREKASRAFSSIFGVRGRCECREEKRTDGVPIFEGQKQREAKNMVFWGSDFETKESVHVMDEKTIVRTAEQSKHGSSQRFFEVFCGESPEEMNISDIWGPKAEKKVEHC